jgi:hypothetical protein
MRITLWQEFQITSLPGVHVTQIHAGIKPHTTAVKLLPTSQTYQRRELSLKIPVMIMPGAWDSVGRIEKRFHEEFTL